MREEEEKKSDDCTAFNSRTEYGHIVAGTITCPNHDLAPLSLVCAACKRVQTWMLAAGTKPSDIGSLRCYGCSKTELSFSPIGPTR